MTSHPMHEVSHRNVCSLFYSHFRTEHPRRWAGGFAKRLQLSQSVSSASLLRAVLDRDLAVAMDLEHNVVDETIPQQTPSSSSRQPRHPPAPVRVKSKKLKTFD